MRTHKTTSPPTFSQKLLEVSKRRPSTAKDILLEHVSKDIVKRKRHKTHGWRQVISRGHLLH